MIECKCPLCGDRADGLRVWGSFLIGCPCVGDRVIAFVGMRDKSTDNHDPGDEDRSER